MDDYSDYSETEDFGWEPEMYWDDAEQHEQDCLTADMVAGEWDW